MIYRFGQFELDPAKVELTLDGTLVPVEPQVFALIAFLVEHRERVISRDELFEKLWEGRIVSDSALSSRIKSARKALGDNGAAQCFIKTVHRKGFRFIAAVQAQQVEGGRAVFAGVEPLPTVAATEAAGLRRPSIAVLPFQLVAGPHMHESFADGLAQDLITALSRLRWLFVIARGSSFRLRDIGIDPREVGRLLNVRYCLSGTVEVTGTRMIVNAELADTRAGDVVWAERYGGLISEAHDVLNEIVSKILASLEIQIPIHEASQARLVVTENLDAWSNYHIGLQHMYRFSREDNLRAAELFERAIRLDPHFARAHAGLSFVHFQSAFMHQTDDIGGAIAASRASAQRGLDIDPLDPFVNFTMGRSFWPEGDLDCAMVWLERAISLNPNYAQGIYARGWTETMAGRTSEAREHVDLAMRLSPIDPLYYAMIATRGLTHVAAGELTEAADWTERAARSPGAHVLIAMITAAVQWLAGNRSKAAFWADNVRKRNPTLSRHEFFDAFPFQPEPLRARLAEALISLGF